MCIIIGLRRWKFWAVWWMGKIFPAVCKEVIDNIL
jgi:hypothetical protein